MNDFVVSARKYRPVSFDTVVGQSEITSTLKSAILKNQLAHAYLFCGPRGVGKTTCARIFAKTINCMNLGEDAEPCNTCESCRAFNENRSMNIHELDAASNNKVDDIRALVEQVRIYPAIGKYNIYIIDEVHMLSTSAFNAFLKTLEEPPAHAVFILATTEKHKIIPTILSRCQIYDFHRITVDDTVAYLSRIAAKEGVKTEEDALRLIARKSDGAMRDALSQYDQLVNFCRGDISYNKVISCLNVLDYDYFFKVTELAYSGKITELMLLFNEIVAKGFDMGDFITGVAAHFRDLLMAKDESTLKLIQTGDSIKQRYKEQAAEIPEDFIFEGLKIMETAAGQYRLNVEKRLGVEIALIKLAQTIEFKKKI